MSEDKTAEMNGAASFEERVFARFDAIDRHSANMQQQFAEMRQEFAEVRERVERLEAKQYDTKPIWEQALAAIMELRQEIQQIHRELKDINRKLDVLNKDMLQMRANQNDFDNRLERLESLRG